MMRAAYQMAFATFIQHLDAEKAHHQGISALALAGKSSVTRGLMRATLGYLPRSEAYAREIRIGDRIVSGRLGLAAGMDKNAEAVLALHALGFGFIEIGTVTPLPQSGNEQPRLWRIVPDRAVRNRMGFNNDGADIVAERLRTLRSTSEGRAVIVGANIGKNKVTPEEDAASDYYTCAFKLSPWVDFIVINVSSPNTPGLRNLQSVEALSPIIDATRQGCEDASTRNLPIFVKIAPDLADEDIVAVAALSKEKGLAGVVATNTTIQHDLGDGGLSGQPLRERARDVVRLLGQHLDDEQLLIGVGGITTIDDALDMLEAGADLVEGLTAFIYEGPSWPGRLNRALAQF